MTSRPSIDPAATTLPIPAPITTQVQIQEESKRMLYSKYKFKQNSKLKEYILTNTTRHQEFYTLAEVCNVGMGCNENMIFMHGEVGGGCKFNIFYFIIFS